MGSIKLKYNKQSILIYKSDNFYQIKDINQWIFLTKFSKAFLIIDYPNGMNETLIDKKFVYNQNFELVNDLDFEFRYILPLGNLNPIQNSYPHDTIPFTGILNGNNFTIKNINIINTNYNGLFGIIKSATIKNLVLENIVIQQGNENGGLVSKAYGCDIDNIKIIGNILIEGINSGCISSYYEGNMSRIYICVDGIINSIKRAIISNGFFGTIDYLTVITNLEDSPGLLNIINGKIINCSLISFNTIEKPFYQETKYHQINSCYYFQLNTDNLPQMQNLYSCYYRNLNNTVVWSNNINTLSLQNLIKINSYYYINSNINYSNEEISCDQNLMVYDLVSDYTNICNFTIIKKDKFFSNPNIIPFDKQRLIDLIQKMEKEFKSDNSIKNKIIAKNFKNRLIKINGIKDRFSYDLNGTLETIKEDMNKYESDSDTEKSDIDTNIKNPIQDISNEQIMSAELMILEELKNINVN